MSLPIIFKSRKMLVLVSVSDLHQVPSQRTMSFCISVEGVDVAEVVAVAVAVDDIVSDIVS